MAFWLSGFVSHLNGPPPHPPTPTLSLQRHVLIGHVWLPLSPPSVPPSCRSLHLFFCRGPQFDPSCPWHMHFYSFSQSIQTSVAQCQMLGPLIETNNNPRQVRASIFVCMFMYVLDWWMRRIHMSSAIVQISGFCKISEKNCTAVMSAVWQQNECGLNIMHKKTPFNWKDKDGIILGLLILNKTQINQLSVGLSLIFPDFLTLSVSVALIPVMPTEQRTAD